MPDKHSKNPLDEDALIELAKGILGQAPDHVPVSIGDDCAVMRSPGRDADILVTTDMLVEGTHFRLEWASPYQVGWKSMAASVSDIAAMGGRPSAAVVSVGIRSSRRETFFRHFYEGVAAAADRYGFSVVGGDTVKSDNLVISVTMTGIVPQGKAVLRKGARPGDAVFVAGVCGDSAAGYDILYTKGKTNLSGVESRLVDRHLKPEPSVEAALAAAASGAVTAMMDLSDGLSADLPRLLKRSGAGALIHSSRIPVSSELLKYCRRNGKRALDFALAGGEDYNLLIAADPNKVDILATLLSAAGASVIQIGEIKELSKGIVITGEDNAEEPWPEKGFRHFST